MPLFFSSIACALLANDSIHSFPLPPSPSLSVCPVPFPLCSFSLLSLSLFPMSLGFSETHQMGRAAAYLISHHARGSIVNHLGWLTVTHQHISEQGHDTGARWLSSSWQGWGQPSSHLYQRVLPACFCTCCLACKPLKAGLTWKCLLLCSSTWMKIVI